MIKSLELKNIALVENANIDFSLGLNVLSGETGAGKSVVIDAINFALGAKADKSMIRFGATECSVTAVFDLTDSSEARSVLESFGTEADDELIVYRKFTADAKGFIRVNGEPYTVAMLKKVTSLLVDVHGQSDHYSLLKPLEQLKVLDRFCDSGIITLKNEISAIIKQLKEVDEIISGFGGNESERAIRADVLKFQINEIKSAELKEGEEEELLVKRKKIQNAEKLKEAFSGVKSSLDGEECALDLVNEAIRSLSPILSVDDKYYSLSERLKSVVAELSDVSDTVEDYFSDFDFDENEADEVEDRIDKIKVLKKKYGFSVDEIFKFLENAENEYEKLVNFDAEFEKISLEKEKLLDRLNDVYKKLSALRRKGAEDFCLKVRKELLELGMKNSQFEIGFGDLSRITDSPYPQNGNDEIEFLFSANLGEPVKPLSKIISGGEMSRFMLAVKAIISEYQEIGTYIFDEIDVGLGGNTGWIVSEKFAKIAKNTQVIAISHLPQICAAADVSIMISKNEINGKTFSSIARLDDSKRLTEIVRLIGGEDSKTAEKLAVEMVDRARKFKANI